MNATGSWYVVAFSRQTVEGGRIRRFSGVVYRWVLGRGVEKRPDHDDKLLRISFNWLHTLRTDLRTDLRTLLIATFNTFTHVFLHVIFTMH